MLNGKRIRQNFLDAADALEFCNRKNADAVGVKPDRVSVTSLALADLRAAEYGVQRAEGRWPLSAIIDAGISVLINTPKSELVAPLADEWLILVASEVNAIWAGDLRQRVLQFLALNPDLTTDQFTSVYFQTFIDGWDVGQYAKANMRNCVHRFCNWLIKRGKLIVNPAKGMRIKAPARAGGHNVLPSVLTAAQAAAFMRAVELPTCRRLKGWAALCLFAGLRPGGKADSGEAPLLTWPEVKFQTGEISLLGRKRGAKVRIFKMDTQTMAWMTAVKKDGEDTPGQFWRHLRRTAIKIANVELLAAGQTPIKWDWDILRHTHASVRASEGVSINSLAADMGTSTEMIYAHYRHPLAAEEVSAFRKIFPR